MVDIELGVLRHLFACSALGMFLHTRTFWHNYIVLHQMRRQPIPLCGAEDAL